MAVNMLQAFDAVLFLKDADTKLVQHHKAVCKIACYIARNIGLPNELFEVVRIASLLHDIGKIDIPNEILYKPTRLTPEEWNVMKLHPITGAQVLSNQLEHIGLPGFKDVVKAIRHHHERYDGSGYPDGLKGDEIPLAARIIAIADSFDAMTCDRPYRKKLTQLEAYREILRCAGTQFDLEIVSYFVSFEDEMINNNM